MKAKDILYLGVIVLLLWILFSRNSPREVITIERYTDTVTFRDTIREIIPEPYAVYVSKADTITVYVPVSGEPDSMPVAVPIPIENKEYRGENYHAVIRGYRPELLRLELFPETRYIYTTEIQCNKKISRFGFGMQVGCGFMGNELKTYLGLGVHYNLLFF